MPERVDPNHLLLIGAGPGVGAAVVRRFGREGFRSTLISRSGTLDQLALSCAAAASRSRRSAQISRISKATARRSNGSSASQVRQVSSCTTRPYRIRVRSSTPRSSGAEPPMTSMCSAPSVAAQVAVPVLRAAGGGTLLVTSGGFADNPVPGLASLSMGKAALHSAQTLIAAGVGKDGIHAATVTIVGAVEPGTDFDPDNIAELFWTAHTDSKDAWQTEYRFTGT